MPRIAQLPFAVLTLALVPGCGDRREASPVRFEGPEAAEQLLAERRAGGLAGAGVQPGPLVREPIAEEEARALFTMRGRQMVYDPQVYYRYEPNIRNRVRWEEHRDGYWIRSTNGAGLRQDEELPTEPVELMVLVAGDSHVDGVCNNAEAFPAVLAETLRAREAADSVAVVNTGVTGYALYNYLGALEKYLELEPDVFVVTVYGGNDFVASLRVRHYFEGTNHAPNPPDYRDRIEAAKSIGGAGLAQGLNQAAFFQIHPEEIELALDTALSVLAEIGELCRRNDVLPLCVYLPAAYHAGEEDIEFDLHDVLAALSLGPADLRREDRLAERFLAGVRDGGIDVLDLREVLPREPRSCYWRTDLHLNPYGHAVVAREIDAWLADGPRALAPRVAELPDGPFEERDAEGRLVTTGAWRGGRRDGTWTTYEADGVRVSEGAWRDGERDGAWTWWHANGQPRLAGEYAAGDREGTWRTWFPSGQLEQEGAYASGRPHGTWTTWHPSGVRASRGEYAGGEREGAWSTWHENGRPESLVTYTAGVFDGPCREWTEEGVLTVEGTWSAGERSGTWSLYDESGGLLERFEPAGD